MAHKESVSSRVLYDYEQRNTLAHEELKETIGELKSFVQQLNEKIDPILEIYNTAGNLRRALVYIAGTLIAVTGTIFSFKTIFSWFK